MLIKFNRRIAIISSALVWLAPIIFERPISAEIPWNNSPRLSTPPRVIAQNDDGVVLLYSSLPGGIARGQTFRVTLANFIRLDGHYQNPVEVRARVKLFDPQGQVIAQTAEVTIAKNQFRSLDFNRDRLPPPGDERTGRLQVREELTVHCVRVNKIEALIIKQKALEFLPASSELIDNSTGESQTVNPCLPMSTWLQSPSAPSPNPGGLGYGQTLSFSALNPGEAGQPGDLLRVRMRLTDAHGTVIAQSAEVTIPAGEFHSFYFNRNDLPLPGEPGTGRLQVAWRVEAFTQGNSPLPFPLSIEVFDSAASLSSHSKVAYGYLAVPLNQG